MLVLALDTTTRAGSVALARDGEVVEVSVGDATRTHAARLPADLLDCLSRHGLGLRDVDVFAVAAGPGSFTGLRIGIATMQGLAFANGRPVAAVSALDALARAASDDAELRSPSAVSEPGSPSAKCLTSAKRAIGAWMDAQRGEVFAQLYRPVGDGELEELQPASVGAPEAIVAAWRSTIAGFAAAEVRFIGDGALRYASVLRAAEIPGLLIADAVPPLAPVIARMGEQVARRGGTVAPHAVRPIYVRRPDAELARERSGQADTTAEHAATPGADRGGTSQ